VEDDAVDVADVTSRLVVIDGDKGSARPVVALARPGGPRKWGDADGSYQHLLEREIIRQAFLIAARDELGLATRDEVLDDVSPDGAGREVGALSTLARFDRSRAVFRRGEGEASEVLLKKDLGSNPDDSTYRPNLVALAEGSSRAEFPDLLKRLGLKGEANKFRGDAPLPDGVEANLERLGLVENFAAVRALHSAMRADGESPARLAALSRAYAQLGALTTYQWSPAHQAFDARALIYAERLVARDPKSSWALRNRALVRALVGFHFLAIDDLDEAKTLDKDAKEPAPVQDWVEMLDAYLNFKLDRLNAVKGPHARLAAFLKMAALEFPRRTRVGADAARAVIEADPDCCLAYDIVCDGDNLGDLHEMTLRAPEAFGRLLPGSLKAVADLPPPVRARLDDSADEDEAVEAISAAGKPGVDAGEPSWGVLAHLIREARFVHVWRRLVFMAYKWAVPVQEFWEQARGLVAGHRYRPYLDSIAEPRAGLRPFVAFLDKFDLGDVELTQRYFIDVLLRLKHPLGDPAWKASIAHSTIVARDLAVILSNVESSQSKKKYAGVLHNVSPHSPFAIAGLVENDWERIKGDVPSWLAEAGESPALLGALGKKYAELRQYKDAEDYLTRYVAVSPDVWAYQWLAGCYKEEKDVARWKATLDEYLAKTKDVGLDHAKVRVQLADALMEKGKWEEARDYAEAAATTWAGWALLCAGRANEGLHDLERAESWYARAAERYPDSAWLPLFLFRQRIHGVPEEDRDAGARLAALAASPSMVKSGESPYIYWLNGETKKAVETLDAAYKSQPNTLTAACLMLIADEAGDAARRDALLDDICTKLKDQSPNATAICTLFRESLADGGNKPLDLAAVDKILEGVSSDRLPNSLFVVGKFLLNRGRAEEGRKYLRRCAEAPVGFRWVQAIAGRWSRGRAKP